MQNLTAQLQIPKTIIQKIEDPFLASFGVNLYLKREDLIHPYISGNKWRKLKYNLLEAQKQGEKILLTFGGAYSNHIYAVATAGEKFGFQTIGIIRGEEHLPLNGTLKSATANKMKLHYWDRTTYRDKRNPEHLQKLKDQFGDFYLIPEGGSNALAVKGCTEIVSEIKLDFDYLCSACGTGGTLAGLIAGSDGKKKIIGFPALKGASFLYDEINDFIKSYNGKSYQNWELQLAYHFGGYAKRKPQLLEFIEGFQSRNNIPIEPIYTGKMLFGIYDLIEKEFFKKGETILAIHTGGLRG